VVACGCRNQSCTTEDHLSRRSNHTFIPARAQRISDSSDLWETEVVPHLPADLAEQAQRLGAFRRKRGLNSPTDLLRGLLAAVLVSSSLQHLAAWAVLASVAQISAPAWHKHLQNSSAWLLWLLSELLAPPSQPCLRLLPHTDGNILLIDATCLAQQGGSGDDWRLHCAYNFRVGRLVQVTLTDRQSGEHLDYYTIQPGDILVADNGYGYRRSVASVRKQQAHVLIRVRPSTFPFEQANGQPLELIAQLRKRGETIREWQGYCRDADGERYPVRVIAAKLPTAQAAQARARARKRAKQHGRKLQASTLLVAGWLLLVTTLEERCWEASALLRLYQARWQIELVFKRMKSILGLGTLRGRTRAAIEARVRALLVGWALQTDQAAWVRQQLAQLGRETSVVSSWQLSRLSLDVLRQQVRGNWGQARLRACLTDLQRFLSSHKREDRIHQETELRAWLARRPISQWNVLDIAS
jgi:hypothetical protein